MNGQQAAEMIKAERKFLWNIIKDFKPEHGDYRPVEGMMTVNQLIRHVAQTLYWFREGAFGTGFRMDFEKMTEEYMQTTTLDDARAELERAYDEAIQFYCGLSEADLTAPLTPNSIFGESAKLVVLNANTGHTAHHRGALAVYLRLLGITPTMVYAE